MLDSINIQNIIDKQPILKDIVSLKPALWINPNLKGNINKLNLPLSLKDMQEGYQFMQNYAPFIAHIFCETQSTNGQLISTLVSINKFKEDYFKNSIKGNLLLKSDHELPVAGSIKARGGFFEVLQFAHKIALDNDFTVGNKPADFTNSKLKSILSKYTIGVGSTGNLGLSIGLISAKLGFNVNVYMSHDAKQWKKDLLIKSGAKVIEENGDFGVAINKGRKITKADPYGYFVDDENSRMLFLGYSLSAFEIRNQLQEQNIIVDEQHPLFIYSPCGVGGSPGGTMFGLKQLFGNNVHHFFVEPTHSPAVLSGLVSQKMEEICVQDLGIDNITEADGLAVGRPSAFASSIIDKLVSGIYTIEDSKLFELLKKLYSTEGIFIEPSATAGLVGPKIIENSIYLRQNNISSNNITHIAWSTGGSLMPQSLKNELTKI